MKFTTTTVSLGLALTAVATPTQNKPAPVERDAAPFTSVIAAIEAEVNSLDSAIKAYKGGAPSAIQSASDAIVSITSAGTKTLEAQDDLSLNDASLLVGPITNLAKDISQDVTDLISIKSKLVAAGAGAQTYNDLQEQDSAAKGLAAAIQSKVPSGLAPVASGLAASVTQAIESGISAFEDVKTNSGSAAAPTTAAETTGAATTAAATTGASYPTSAAATTPAGTGVVPTGTGSVTTTSSRPFTTGAASMNGVSGLVGAAAAVVAMFAL